MQSRRRDGSLTLSLTLTLSWSDDNTVMEPSSSSLKYPRIRIKIKATGNNSLFLAPLETKGTVRSQPPPPLFKPFPDLPDLPDLPHAGQLPSILSHDSLIFISPSALHY